MVMVSVSVLVIKKNTFLDKICVEVRYISLIDFEFNYKTENKTLEKS